MVPRRRIDARVQGCEVVLGQPSGVGGRGERGGELDLVVGGELLERVVHQRAAGGGQRVQVDTCIGELDRDRRAPDHRVAVEVVGGNVTAVALLLDDSGADVAAAEPVGRQQFERIAESGVAIRRSRSEQCVTGCEQLPCGGGGGQDRCDHREQVVLERCHGDPGARRGHRSGDERVDGHRSEAAAEFGEAVGQTRRSGRCRADPKGLPSRAEVGVHEVLAVVEGGGAPQRGLDERVEEVDGTIGSVAHHRKCAASG